MSKVENQVEDAKKLALRCKTLEMQLRQSVSKKEHNEVTSKLEKQVDTLEKDLDRARAENQKTIAINKQIAGVEALVSSLVKTANAQGKTLDFIEEEASTRGKAQGAQGKTLDAVAAKISQGTVPSNVHLQALSKIRDLEEDKRGMVRRFDYNSLEAKCAELSRQLGTMVPSSDYISLKEKFDEVTRQVGDMVPASEYAAQRQRVEELEGAISSMVPREQFASSEARVSELETRLAEHVPQSIYDELVSKVISLAEAVTGGAVQPEEARADPQPEATAPEPLAQTVAGPELHIVEAAAPEVAAQIVSEVAPTEVLAPEAPAQIAETVTEPQLEAVGLVAAEEITAEVQVTKEVDGEQSIPEVAEPNPQPAVPAPSEPTPPDNAVPEIREVASQLAEINSQAQEAQGEDAAIGEAPTEEPQVEAAAPVSKDAEEPVVQQVPAIAVTVADGEETA